MAARRAAHAQTAAFQKAAFLKDKAVGEESGLQEEEEEKKWVREVTKWSECSLVIGQCLCW